MPLAGLVSAVAAEEFAAGASTGATPAAAMGAELPVVTSSGLPAVTGAVLSAVIHAGLANVTAAGLPAVVDAELATAATGAVVAGAALAPGIINRWPVVIRSGFLMPLACMRAATDAP